MPFRFRRSIRIAPGLRLPMSERMPKFIRRGQKEAHQHGTPASIFKILLAKEKAQRIAADVKSKPPARLSS